MEKYKERKTKGQVIVISFMGIILLVIAIVLMLNSIKSKDQYLMHYSDSSNLDYNVYLKKNSFYTTPYLPKDKVYISNLIDYIDASFKYDFDVIEDINLGYKYYISAKVEIDGGSDKKVFEQEEILLDNNEVKNVNDKKFSISENMKIDYNKYNKLVNSFINEYGISAEANLIVSLYVEVEGTIEKFEKKLNDKSVASFVIPLKTDMTDIKINYDLTDNVNKTFEYGKTSIVNPALFIVSIVIASIAIIGVVYEIVRYIITMDPKERYRERLKKIFKDYGPYISKKSMRKNTKEIMNTVSLRVEMVDTFDDLINVRDSVEKPILFYEAVPGEQAVFYIIDTKVTYIYVLNANDLDYTMDRTQMEVPLLKSIYTAKNSVKTVKLEEKDK